MSCFRAEYRSLGLLIDYISFQQQTSWHVTLFLRDAVFCGFGLVCKRWNVTLVPLLPAGLCILLAQEGQCFGKETELAFPRFQRSQVSRQLLPSTRPAARRSRGVSSAWRPPGGELPQHEPDTHRAHGLRALQGQLFRDRDYIVAVVVMEEIAVSSNVMWTWLGGDVKTERTGKVSVNNTAETRTGYLPDSSLQKKNCCPAGSDTVQYGRNVRIFQRFLLPPSTLYIIKSEGFTEKWVRHTSSRLHGVTCKKTIPFVLSLKLNDSLYIRPQVER
jgi:hypothetical protein